MRSEGAALTALQLQQWQVVDRQYRKMTGRYINVSGKFSGTTWDAFHFAGKASRATNFQGHLPGYLTQDEIPQPSFQIGGQISIDLGQCRSSIAVKRATGRKRESLLEKM